MSRASGRRPDAAPGDAGFTLIEMLVALVIFSLIGVAGFGVLDTIIKVRDRTEGRLERMADIDRALTLFARDLTQLDECPLSLEEGALRFSRQGPGGAIAMRYALRDGVMYREALKGAGDAPVAQALLSGVVALDWRFLDRADGWVDVWPPENAAQLPRAVALDLSLEGASGASGAVEVSRLVDLPQPGPPR